MTGQSLHHAECPTIHGGPDCSCEQISIREIVKALRDENETLRVACESLRDTLENERIAHEEEKAAIRNELFDEITRNYFGE